MRFRHLSESAAYEFAASDARIRRIYSQATRKALSNISDFAGRRVLVEGGGYHKIWLETQPMGGEMYALSDMQAALNNQLLFMEHARADGRIPGSITTQNGALLPQYNKFQGFCFAEPALEMYYIAGADDEYLKLLARTLEGFDEYLWRARDTDGDGLLESFCMCDTGEDHAARYSDAPFLWEDERAPEGYASVPFASMDVTGYSFSARATLARIYGILGDHAARARWAALASDVSARIQAGFWDNARGAYFDRLKTGEVAPTLVHNTLRLMYWGQAPSECAARFVSEHLLNPDEFWTRFPLPSVAANDPLFKNIPENNWSGQPEGLTYQRAIRALDNYGMPDIITRLGRKLISAVGREGVFTQQFDPFTGKPSIVKVKGAQGQAQSQDAYGPTLLAALEYIKHMYGIRLRGNDICFGALGDRGACEANMRWAGREYKLAFDGARARAYINGREILDIPRGSRAITSLTGECVRLENIDPGDDKEDNI